MDRYASFGDSGIDSHRCLTALAVICVALGSGSHSQYACAGEPAPATTHAAIAATDKPSLALLDVLNGVQWPKLIKRDWSVLVASMEDVSKNKRTREKFDLTARDRLLGRLEAALAKTGRPPEARYLILEHIGKEGGTSPEYERFILFSPVGIDRETVEELRRHNSVELKEDAWTKMAGWIKTSVKGGGGDNGIKHVMDHVDTTILSYYDGVRWNVAVWMWFDLYVAELMNPPEERSSNKHPIPSAEAMAFANLLDFLDAVPEVRKRFDPTAYASLKAYVNHAKERQ